jgi:hypothetical protein
MAINKLFLKPILFFPTIPFQDTRLSTTEFSLSFINNT